MCLFVEVEDFASRISLCRIDSGIRIGFLLIIFEKKFLTGYLLFWNKHIFVGKKVVPILGNVLILGVLIMSGDSYPNLSEKF